MDKLKVKTIVGYFGTFEKFVDLSEYHIRLVSYLNRDTEKSNNPSQYIDIEQRKVFSHWLSAKI